MPQLMTDIPRLKEGLVGGQIFSVYTSCGLENKDAVRSTQEQIDVVLQLARKYSGFFQVASTSQELLSIYRGGGFPSLMGMEGGHQIDNSLASLRAFRQQGVRYMTLTHNCDTVWAESCCANHSVFGLTSFGRAVVREMNRLGVMVDISHASVQTMHDALDASMAPVIFSHSNAYALAATPRNVPDDVLARMPANGGAVCITFVPSFVNFTDPQGATIAQVADHIEYIAAKASFDNVCLGADFDGISETITGLGNVSTYPYLVEELVSRQWAVENIIKLIGGNILRVLQATEQISDSMSNIIPGQSVLNNLSVPTGCRTLYFPTDQPDQNEDDSDS